MAAPTAPVLGLACKLYRNTGTYGSPTWNEIPNVGTIEPDWSMEEFALKLRSGGGFTMTEPTLANIGFEMEMMYDPADADMTTLLAAHYGRTATEFLILDQASGTTGSQGIRASFKSTDMKRTEVIDGVTMMKFAFKICYSANPPTWYTAA